MKVFRPVTLATCLTQSVTNISVRVSGNKASESIHGTGDNNVDDGKVNSTLGSVEGWDAQMQQRVPSPTWRPTRLHSIITSEWRSSE